MKLLADENVDWPIVQRLREHGHDVRYVLEIAAGMRDEAVFELARSENLILLTADKDFGEMAFRQRKVLRGTILLRLSGVSPGKKAKIVTVALEKYGQKMENAFTVITSKSVRIRPW